MLRRGESRSVRPEPTAEGRAPPAFVGREDLVEEFRAHLDSPPDQRPPVIVYHGIGGLGKSSLLEHLREECRRGTKAPYAWVDFDSGAAISYVSPERGLWEIANGLADRGQFAFPTFLEVWGALDTRRTGRKWEPPECPLTRWTRCAAEVASVPLPVVLLVWKLGEALWELVGQRIRGTLAREADHERWTPQRLRSLDEDDLVELLPEALCKDLKAQAARRRLAGRPGMSRPLIFLDTYEDLQRVRTRQPDRFVRTLAEGATNALIVVAGRRPLDWPERDPHWRDETRLVQHELTNLSLDQCKRYLESRGISDDEVVAGLFSLTKGFPLALALAADVACEATDRAKAPLSFEQLQRTLLDDPSPTLRRRLEDYLPPGELDLAGLSRVPEKLLAEILLCRLLREVPGDERGRILRACVPRYLTDEIVRVLWPGEEYMTALRNRLLSYSFVSEDTTLAGEQRWTIHSIVRQFATDEMTGAPLLPDLHLHLAEYFEAEAAERGNDETRFALRVESLYHRVAVDEQVGCEALREVFEECLEAREWSRCTSLLAVLDQHERIGHVVQACRAYCAARMIHISYGAFQGETGDYRDAALSLLERALRDQQQDPDSALKAAMYLRVARLYRDHQRFGEALRWYRRCRETCAVVHTPLVLAECLVQISHTKWTMNPDSGSIGLLDQARRLAEGEGVAGIPVVLSAVAERVDVLRDTRRFEEALTAAHEGRDLAQGTGNKWAEADFQRRIVELLLLQAADSAAVEEALLETERLYRETETPEGDVVLLRRVQAGLSLLKGDHGAALASFQRCLSEEKTIYKSRYGVAISLLDIGRCWERMGDPLAALAHTATATAILKQMEETTVYQALDEEQRMRRAYPDIDEAALARRTAELTREHAPWVLTAEGTDAEGCPR